MRVDSYPVSTLTVQTLKNFVKGWLADYGKG